MLLTNKSQATVSILTTGWLITFIFLSTSHLGNSHCIYLTEDTKDQYSFTQSFDKNNRECPWTFSGLMTIGESLVFENDFNSVYAELNVVELQNFCIKILCFHANQRDPPVV